MKSALLSSIIALSTIATAAMADIPPQPARCPSASILQQGQFLAADKEKDGKYVAIQISSYDTSETWGFAVGEITANSNADAMNKAHNAVTSYLRYKSGPQYFESAQTWVCQYDTSSGYLAIALSPLPKGAVNTAAVIGINPAKLIQFGG